ncbi:MAG: toprim domain-containing protein [Bacteroidales bacterium]|jgi:DNA primase|nr:toprim domain-containing protein [Bacteroidales bacterium]
MSFDIQSAKRISIQRYLSEHNVEPVRRGGDYLLYHAPYREDKNPSMAVFTDKNTWKDYATGQGGSIIDLVMAMQHLDFVAATKKLLSATLDAEVPEVQLPMKTFASAPKNRDSQIIIFKECCLGNRALLSYLEERAVPYSIAKNQLKEVYFTTKEGLRTGKRYFAVAFKNDAGGYELRNKYFKGATSKDVTTVRRNSEKCLVFEGFMDYLSYLTLAQQKGIKTKENAIILNSVALLESAKPFLCEHKEIHCYMDNDEAGKRAVEQIKSWSDKNSVIDKSQTYGMNKDINEYLQQKQLIMNKINYKPLKKQSYGNGRNL